MLERDRAALEAITAKRRPCEPIEKLPVNKDAHDYAHDVAEKVNEIIDRVNYLNSMMKELSDYPRLQSLATNA